MILGGQARVPVHSGTAAEMAALTSMLEGDIYYTTDTKKVFTYDGAAWNDVVAGISNEIALVASDTLTGASTWDKSGLSTTAYRYYVVVVEASNASAGAVTMRFNNNSANHYYTLYFDISAGTIVKSGAGSSFTLSANSQQLIGAVWIPVKASATTAGFSAHLSDGNMDSDIGIGAYYAGGGDISRITLNFAAATTGKITLLGVI